MTRRFLISTTLIFCLVAALGCDRNLQPKGYFWFGHQGRIAIFDLDRKKTIIPDSLAGCDQAGADFKGESLYFICANDAGRELRYYNATYKIPVPTLAKGKLAFTDPRPSPDGTRALLRIRRTGEVSDAHMFFQGSGYVPVARRVTAAAFGQDDKTLYLAQGEKIAAHVIEDLTRPDQVPPEGLRSLLTAGGVVRDIDFHIATRWLAICAGTKVMICQQDGQDTRTVFDTIKSSRPGPVRFPYRIRWSPDGSMLAVILSANGETGNFVVIDTATGKHVFVKGVNPVVGGFAWTADRIYGLR